MHRHHCKSSNPQQPSAFNESQSSPKLSSSLRLFQNCMFLVCSCLLLMLLAILFKSSHFCCCSSSSPRQPHRMRKNDQWWNLIYERFWWTWHIISSSLWSWVCTTDSCQISNKAMYNHFHITYNQLIIPAIYDLFIFQLLQRCWTALHSPMAPLHDVDIPLLQWSLCFFEQSLRHLHFLLERILSRLTHDESGPPM